MASDSNDRQVKISSSHFHPESLRDVHDLPPSYTPWAGHRVKLGRVRFNSFGGFPDVRLFRVQHMSEDCDFRAVFDKAASIRVSNALRGQKKHHLVADSAK
jgi:hypothetical protein